MPVDTDFQAIAQSFLSPDIASNYFLRDPKLYFLAAMTGEYGKPSNVEIGRPSGSFIFQGTKLSPVERMSLSGINSYKTGFQYQNPTNVKIMGARDTAPQLSAAVTGSQDQIRGTAEIMWTGKIKEQIIIWNETLHRAVQDAGSSTKGRGVARARVIEDATKVASQNVYSTLSTELQSGDPSDQDQDPWDHLQGFASWFSATNVNSRVNRSLSKNANWRAQVDSTARAPVAADIIDLANITYQLEDKSEDGCVALFVNNAQYIAMKAEILGRGGVELLNGLPDMAHYGMKKRYILQKDNTFIVRDRNVPASTCYAIVPNTWKFITHPDFTFRVTPFRDLSEYSEGAKDALQAYVELRCMLVCTNPGLNVVFNNITDPS